MELLNTIFLQVVPKIKENKVKRQEHVSFEKGWTLLFIFRTDFNVLNQKYLKSFFILYYYCLRGGLSFKSLWLDQRKFVTCLE